MQAISQYYHLDNRLKRLEYVLFERREDGGRVNQQKVVQAYGRYSQQIRQTFQSMPENVRALVAAYHHDLRQQMLAIDQEEVALEFDIVLWECASRIEEIQTISTDWHSSGRAVLVSLSVLTVPCDAVIDRYLNAIEQKSGSRYQVTRCKIKEQGKTALVELTLTHQSAIPAGPFQVL